MLIFYTTSSNETADIGLRIGSLLRTGDVVCLSGDLGAGKTILAQGIALGLAVNEPVTSPTFTVMQMYEGRVPVFHYDLYRLNRPEELLDIGFEEYSGSYGVSIIEWPDKFPDYMPTDALWISLSRVNERERKIELIPHGERYETLLRELTNR